MSLRRTALSRKAELRRQSELRRTPLARKRDLRARSVKAAQRPRDTGPTPAVRRLVLDRAGGCCELCGRLLHDGTRWLPETHSFHHRRPRGLGGSSWEGINLPSNLLLLCGSATTPGGCHALVESGRARAYDEGWLVRQSSDPATVPVAVFSGWRERWVGGTNGTPAVPIEPLIETRRVLLTPDGDYEEIAA